MIDLSELIARMARLERWAWGESVPVHLGALQSYMPKVSITAIEPELASQPVGVANDIWATACDLWMDEGADDGAVILAKALQAERSRAQSIAMREHRRHDDDSDAALATVTIALAIAEGEKP